ncbi:MAG: TetR family transcriptional regulator [Thalassolituus sp.]|jgi:AcrR family transcriptional regulator|nr:helix-turn-helix domain-containing protein [Pseudomonadota bacterium]MEC8103914.1 helix-turn-helix domain-containing protein [Pseudomonadota bacterium]TNC84255.1 MAG: TetR family transcriptional regulator [Thalassolituus sp.]|tara:strand:+ start:75 stop:623 length:549 start_codon:yes stop_codon:yes gene_type:complete
MARNKRHLDQKVKKEEIETVAMSLFKEQGYDKTSMAKVAKEAGVAANTIYWYYENKDDLLIAVLNREVMQAMPLVLAMQSAPLSERVLTLIAQVESAGALMTDVHARVSHSDVVKQWHDRFHQMVEQLSISELIKAGVSPEHAACDARLMIYVIEGLLAHQHTMEERVQVVEHALSTIRGKS